MPVLYASPSDPGRRFLVAVGPEYVAADRAAELCYSRIAEILHADGLEIVQERIFASLEAEEAVTAARRNVLASHGIRADGPMSYLQGHPLWGVGFAGAIVHAVRTGPEGEGVRPVVSDGVACGRTWREDGATFTILQNIQGLSREAGADNSRASQCRRMIDQADRILREHGLAYRHTVRTWFYLSDILEWYGEFNRVRNESYGRFGLLPQPGERPRLLPASTGIRADRPGGAACSLDLLALGGADPGRPTVEFLRNPRQQEAFCYGSAFSRSAVIRGERDTLIQVSGTAAIDENGRSLYPGDVRSQIRCTFDKVVWLLDQARASLKDICAATVFLKNRDDAAALRETLTDLGLERFPAVYVVADVCREELLFEVDAEAVVPRAM